MTEPGPELRTADPAVRAALSVAVRALEVGDVALVSGNPSQDGATSGRSLCVPVPVTSGAPLMLVATAPEGRTFGPDHGAILESVAVIVATLLDRAHVGQAQATVAAFGRLSLTSRDIDTLLQRGLDAAVELLDTAAAGLVVRRTTPGRVAVVCVHGPVSADPGEEHPESDVTRLADTERPGYCRTFELAVGGRLWGRLITVDPEPRAPTEAQLDATRTVVAIMGAALQREINARRLRDTARTLQEALLPTRVPAVPGIETAARYLPGRGDRVSGDWYDVLPLPHGAVALVMGHVEGNDVTAAAVMGQVRNAVRAYAADGHPPAEVVNRAHRFLARQSDRLATCCYLELHPSELTVTGVSAGRPCPIVVSPDGELPLPSEPGPPLGAAGDPHHVEQTWMLPDDATLLLLTRGLLDNAGRTNAGRTNAGRTNAGRTNAAGTRDRRDGDHESATRRAISTVAIALSRHPVDTLADALTAARPDAGAPDEGGDLEPPDDAALLVVRISPSATPLTGARTGQARRAFRPMPESVPAARRFVRDLLAGWDRSDLEDAALLAVSELVTNAVIHTAGPILLTLRRPSGRGLWVGVHDDSDRFVSPRHASEDDITGRGLAIVEVLADRWGVETAPGRGGKTVWFELGSQEEEQEEEEELPDPLPQA